MAESEDFFTKYGLDVEKAEPEVGVTYPLYGIITDVLSEDEEGMNVTLNFNIRLKLNVDSAEKRKVVRERAFEPGIFITKITKKLDDGDICFEGICTTVVFGKKQANYV